MKLIVPNDLTLLACSIAEVDSRDGVLWSASTTYAKNAKVRYKHVSYTSLEADNKGNVPADTWSGENAKWKKLEATLPWKMLDDYVETQTISATGKNLAFSVPYSYADAISLLNLKGESLEIGIYDLDEPEGEQKIYSETITLLADIFHLSLYEYNYLPITNVKSITLTDLPEVTNGKLNIYLTAGAETESCAVGHVVVGKAHTLGDTEYGAERSFTDYSRKIIDEFGVTKLVKRSYASHSSLPIYLHPDQMDYVISVLEDVRATPCVWQGDNSDDGHASLIVYGWLEDYRMVCEGPNKNQLSLEIQGLI